LLAVEYKRYPWGLSKKGCCMERMLYFISPPQDLPLVGNIKVPVKQYHHIYQPSDKYGRALYRPVAAVSYFPFSFLPSRPP
jgi:hypothetical protein